MARGGGIVGSDLEQIGEVLSPAIRAANIGKVPFSVSDQRAVLCKPGSVEQFVQAVLFLARSPQLCEALGRNARVAAATHFSWRRHVERLWELAVRTHSGVAVTQQRPS
jgi:glycosyltransferase involved in cell wall biosynthesis